MKPKSSYEISQVLLDENKEEENRVKEYLILKVIQYLKALDLLMIPDDFECVEKAFDKEMKKEREKETVSMANIMLLEEAKSMLHKVIEEDRKKFQFLFYVTSR